MPNHIKRWWIRNGSWSRGCHGREPKFDGMLAQTVSSERDWHEDLEFHFSLIDRRNGQVLGIAGLNRDGVGSLS